MGITWGPFGAGGEAYGDHLQTIWGGRESIWGASGDHLGREGKHLGIIWRPFGAGGRAFGEHLGSIWGPFGVLREQMVQRKVDLCGGTDHMYI